MVGITGFQSPPSKEDSESEMEPFDEEVRRGGGGVGDDGGKGRPEWDGGEAFKGLPFISVPDPDPPEIKFKFC